MTLVYALNRSRRSMDGCRPAAQMRKKIPFYPSTSPSPHQPQPESWRYTHVHDQLNPLQPFCPRTDAQQSQGVGGSLLFITVYTVH